jgi:putative glutamine amidotransferase
MPVIGITAFITGESLKVRTDYISAVSDAGALPLILPVTAQVSELSDIIDGLLLTGGRDIPPDYYGEALLPSDAEKLEKRERVEFEMSMLGEVLKRSKPVLAICYGMQLLNVFHGGTLVRDIGEMPDKHAEHTGGTHEADISDISGDAPERRHTVNSFHHQAIDRIGSGLSVFALATDGIIEGIFKRDYNHCVGVQWHPERMRTDSFSEWLFKSLALKADEARRRR